MEKRQGFTAEFKREAVRLMRRSGRPAAVVVREEKVSGTIFDRLLLAQIVPGTVFSGTIFS